MPAASPAPERPSDTEAIKEAWPAGHFYSPIPSVEDVEHGLKRERDSLLGIDLNLAGQQEVLAELEAVYPQLRFPDTRTTGRRYFYQNGSFGALDAVSLAAMARKFQPRRIIEVGSGHSSAAMLDLVDDGILRDCELRFIDPDFSRLKALLLPGDLEKISLTEARVQDVDVGVFQTLEAGDILFIDSSHVAKVGSDVNHLLFRIIPALKPGVVVHIHDVFSAFEYPEIWYKEGRYWNEQYLIRAFLMFNAEFEIVFLSAYMFDEHNAIFCEKMPATTVTGGGQLWIRRKPR